MPRKPTYELIRCKYFRWRLRNRDGTWYADGRSNPTNAGRHSLGTKDKQEALQLLHELDQQRAEDLGLAPRSTSQRQQVVPLAIDEGRRLYQEHYSRPGVAGGVVPGTQKRYRAAFDKFVKFAKTQGITTWNGVTKQILIRYAAHLEQTEYSPGKLYLPKTIRDDITTIKQCVRYLIDEGHLQNAEPMDLQLQRAESERHYCWRPKEVKAMVDHCEESPDLDWLQGIIVGLACTGMRIGELASLKWSDLDLEKRVIQLSDERGHRGNGDRQRRTIKGKRSRTFPIHPAWLDVLKRIPRKDAYVYHGPRGGRLKPDTARIVLKRDVIEPLIERFPSSEEEQGFKDGRFHSFRHFFCSTCANSGIPERIVMEWLGHKDSEMVRHYFHLNDRESRRRMDQLDPLGGDSIGRSDNGS